MPANILAQSRILREDGKAADAIDLLRENRDLFGEDNEVLILVELAHCQYALGDMEMCKKAAQAANELDSEIPSIQQYLLIDL